MVFAGNRKGGDVCVREQIGGEVAMRPSVAGAFVVPVV
jgi:hypothetical protein